MLNKEKYAKKILDIACEGRIIALRKCDRKLMACGTLCCAECVFSSKEYEGCASNIRKWCNTEYKPFIDWSKVAVDTPILVSDNGKNWHKRHFAKYEDGKVYAWKEGKTSWTRWTRDDVMIWKYAKLAESEE